MALLQELKFNIIKKRVEMNLFRILLFVILTINISCAQTNDDELFVAHWNVENLFDTNNDPKTNDDEFLSAGAKEWNEERLDRKMYNLARVIRAMNNNNGPDLLGICESEHQHLLDSLSKNYLSDKNYKTAYLESPDGRGIDNGIIYNADKLSLLNIKGYETRFSDNYDTRLVLLGTFLLNKKDTLYFFVNHWPSRRGGQEASEPRRIRVAETLRVVIDSLFTINPKSKIIIAGDFNDEPTNISITETLGAYPFVCDSLDPKLLPQDFETNLFNASYKAWYDGLGSYFYQQDFSMLDQIIISRELLIGNKIIYDCNSFDVFKPDFMITRTGKFKGAPFPTYGGNRYLGGYSDHYPVTIKLKLLD
jgi:predicted extracellular nuclease